MKYLVKLRKVITKEVEIEIDSNTQPNVASCLEAMSLAETVVNGLDPKSLETILRVNDSGWHSSSVKQESE